MSLLHAHGIGPISANQITLTADPGTLTLQLNAGASFWVKDLFNDVEPSTGAWSAEMLKKTQAYWDQHVRLEVDGQPLASELRQARYTTDVWHFYGGAQLFLTWVYRLPPEGRALNGRITLYEEDFKEDRLHPPPAGVRREYVSHLRVNGGHHQRLSVPLEKPDFSLPLASLYRTPWQRRISDFREGLGFWMWDPAGLLIFATIYLNVLSMSRRVRAGVAAGTALICIVFGLASKMAVWNMGVCLSVLVLFALLEGVGGVYRKHLQQQSESEAQRLFNAHLRFASGVSLLIAALLLFQRRGFTL